VITVGESGAVSTGSLVMLRKNQGENMAFKKIGTELIENDRFAVVCDVCKCIIPDEKYPKIELEVANFEYNGDGTHPDSYDLCCSDCLIRLAKKLKIKAT